jgi:streptomycin 6-kinase
VIDPVAANAGGVFVKAAATFEALAASTGPRVQLHGDLHHANVMRRADGTWAAIDPKGILGDRTLEFAMMLFIDVSVDGGIGDAMGVIARTSLASIVAGVDRERLLAWSFCHVALYAAWSWSAGHPHEALWRPLAEGLEAAAPEPRTLS